MKTEEIQESLNVISEDIKNSLLKGKFTVFGFFENSVQIDVSGIVLNFQLDHMRKRVESNNMYFDRLMPYLDNEAKTFIYHKINEGGIEVAINNNKEHIKRLEKEIITMKAYRHPN